MTAATCSAFPVIEDARLWLELSCPAGCCSPSHTARADVSGERLARKFIRSYKSSFGLGPSQSDSERTSKSPNGRKSRPLKPPVGCVGSQRGSVRLSCRVLVEVLATAAPGVGESGGRLFYSEMADTLGGLSKRRFVFRTSTTFGSAIDWLTNRASDDRGISLI
jgi:hypothetical protein